MDLSEIRPDADPAARHPWELARLEVVDRLLDRTPPASTMLDVGCGDAWLLSQLSTRGRADRYLGVDPELPAARHVNEAGAELVQTLDDTTLEAHEVSHLLFLDVIEHVEDDVGLLEAYAHHPSAREDATILITVPMHPRLFVEHDRLLRHHRRYRREGLLDVVRRAGLRVVDDGGMFSSLLGPRALERAMEAVRPPQRETTDVGTWRAGEGVTEAIRSTLVADFRVSERLRRRGLRLPGLSHFVIASRG
jgi:hypothetical protein